MKTFLRALMVPTILIGSAAASPITFNLQNVTFSDGTAATGSFAYDPATNIYSNLNIATTMYGAFPTFAFDDSNSFKFNASADRLRITSQDTFPVTLILNERLLLKLSFSDALSETTTSDAIQTGASYECLNCNPYRGIAGGSVVAQPTLTAATPEPSSLALLSTGVLGVAGLVKRRFLQG